MILTFIGGSIEILGLGVAAFGLVLTWRGVADGHHLLPLRRKRRHTGHAAAGTLAITSSAYGYVTDPS